MCPTAAIEYVEAETADWLGMFAAERSARHREWQCVGVEAR
jgi:hypothetical protein